MWIRASRKLLIYAKLTVRHCQVGLLNGSFSIGTIGNLLPDRSSSNCRAFTVCHTYPDPARALQFCPSTSLMQSYTHYDIVRARYKISKMQMLRTLFLRTDLFRYFRDLFMGLVAFSFTFSQRYFFLIG